MTNETLIRLKDINKEHGIISSFYTEKPLEYLQVYHFCKKEEIPLQVNSLEETIGMIEEINVFFGGGENIPCIDVWINRW